ncbi:MAG: right-handed parallel beta-helix repeat-containing protein [Deltaproteobacteria bacterium]|nr:right-handed parallel beta-helix repeat-containing protein [Deltaproteobacteria bacterium]
MLAAPHYSYLPVLVLVTLAGCGDDVVSAGDAHINWGNDAGPIELPTVAQPRPPTPPRPAIPPSWDCPAGWRSVSVADGVSECTPWPEGGQLDCPAGEAHFPGTAGCALVGSPCPADGWPAALPAGRPVRYVRAPGTGGNGSLARPFGTINAAVAGATEGDVIAVAAGTYDEFFVLPAGVALYGACAAETILTLTTPSRASVVRTVSAGVELHDVSVRDAAHKGIFVDVGGSMLIEGVELRNLEDTGVLALNADVTLRRVSIHGVVPRASDGVFGTCVTIEDRSTGTIEGLTVGDCVLSGLYAQNSTLTVADMAVTDIRAAPTTEQAGLGIWFAGETTVTASRVSVSAVDDAGVVVISSMLAVRDLWVGPSDGPDTVGIISGARSMMELSGARVGGRGGLGVLVGGGTVVGRDLLVHGAGTARMGSAIGVLEEGRFEAERTYVGFVTGNGVSAEGAGAVVSLRDARIEHVVPTGRTSGAGLSAVELGTLYAEGVEVRHVGVVAAVAANGGTLTVRDLSVFDMDGVADGYWGRALHAQIDGTLDAERVYLERVREAAISGIGSSISVRDIEARETIPNPAPTGDASASVIVSDCDLQIERAAFGDAAVGMHAEGGTVTATDVLFMGGGIQLFGSAIFEGERLHVAAPQRSGLAVFSGSRANVVDLRIEGAHSLGNGIMVEGTAGADVESFAVSGSELCGFYISDGAGLDVRRGLVEGATIGVCVDSSAYDLDRLSSGVRYRDNETNLDGVAGLPVPAPVRPAFGNSSLGE